MTKSAIATLSPNLSQYRRWLADVVLAALVVGPPVAPFLVAAPLPLVPIIGQIIYWMGVHVCPQPDMGLALAPPHLMAVCMRCYGTVLALWFTRLLVGRDQGQGSYWLAQYGGVGVVVACLMMLAYPAELLAQELGWWSYQNLVVTPFGFVAGLGLGLLVMPSLYRDASSATRYRNT